MASETILLEMTRRDLLATLAATSTTFGMQQTWQMSVEGYIFQQYAERANKPLDGVIDEVLPMARSAGFKNIELNPSFFAPAIRKHVLSLISSQGFMMPSVYVGGPMHEKGLAKQTIATAVEIGKVCAPFGCHAIVNNPDPKRNNEPKTGVELAVQADSLTLMGNTLAEHGIQLRVHHHTPQLENNAREWRSILQDTDPKHVFLCVDVDWAYEGGFDPVEFLREAGERVREIHMRSAKKKLWLEDLEDSDIDYRAVASLLKKSGLNPLIVVELAYRANTVVKRSLEKDLQLSRLYAESIFN